LTLRGPKGMRRGSALEDLGLIEDGSVLIRDGLIDCIGSTRRLENLKDARSAVQIPVHGLVVMPGFVDAGIQVSLYSTPASPKARPKRKKMADFQNESLTLLRSCLQHGTLNAQAKAFSNGGGAVADASILRQLARIGSSPVGTVRSWRVDSPADDPDLAKFQTRLSYMERHKLAHVIELNFGPHASTTDILSRALSALASRSSLPLNLCWPGGDPDWLGHLLACVQPRSVFCPAGLGPEECSLFANSSSLVVFSPCKELLEERNNSSVRRLVEEGGAIALASGYDARDAPIFSMQMVVALGVLHLRLTVEQAISATTINGAHAVGRGHEIGSLEVGKRADLLVLNLPDYREIPRRFGINHVALAIRDGNLVLNRNRPKASAV
jgi:cytosine/adenosine deaminase-related metal-dependent hydrolase